MNRKIIPVILIVVAACMALAACMNNGGARPAPGPTANYAPNATDGAANNAQNGNGAAGLTNNGAANNGTSGTTGTNDATGATGNTAATTDGALNPFDWANGAADIEKALPGSPRSPTPGWW